MWRGIRQVGYLALMCCVVGCGITKMTDSPRAASEMLLVSQAVDFAVAKLNFAPLAGETVYLDTTALENNVLDKGYLVGSVKQQLLAHGVLLQEERQNAMYVVELRAGAIGTDRHSVMLGIPAMTLPTVSGGGATNLPEIALARKNDQRGVAKVGVFAYNRLTGAAVWQSEIVEASSQLRESWFLGAGPFARGTIRKQTELAGVPLPNLSEPAERPSDGPPKEVQLTNAQSPLDTSN